MRPGQPKFRRPRDASRYALAALLAVGLQAGLLGLMLLASRLPWGEARPKKVTGKPVALRPISSAEWAKNRGEAPTTPLPKDARADKVKPPPDAPKKEKKKPEEIPEGQVVATAPGNDEQDPNAKYLSESNNRVKKETRAKETTAFYKNAMPERTAKEKRTGQGLGDVAIEQNAGNEGEGEDERPKADAPLRQRMEIPDVEQREEIALRKSEDGKGVRVDNQAESDEVKGNSKRLRIQPGMPEQDDGPEGSLGKIGAGKVNLMPSQAVMDQIAGAAPNDHLAEVEEGEGTFLNTREWKYSSFFNRVKQSIGQHWDPGTQLRLRDPTGDIYGGRDRYTLVNVTLDERGQIKDLFVEKSCGIDFLDREAVASFERAQPFPNPPPGLLKDDATVSFSFGFFLEMSTGGMRLFRRAN